MSPRSGAESGKQFSFAKLAAIAVGLAVVAFAAASLVAEAPDESPPGALDGIVPITDPLKMPDDSAAAAPTSGGVIVLPPGVVDAAPAERLRLDAAPERGGAGR